MPLTTTALCARANERLEVRGSLIVYGGYLPFRSAKNLLTSSKGYSHIVCGTNYLQSLTRIDLAVPKITPIHAHRQFHEHERGHERNSSQHQSRRSAEPDPATAADFARGPRTDVGIAEEHGLAYHAAAHTREMGADGSGRTASARTTPHLSAPERPPRDSGDRFASCPDHDCGCGRQRSVSVARGNRHAVRSSDRRCYACDPDTAPDSSASWPRV